MKINNKTIETGTFLTSTKKEITRENDLKDTYVGSTHVKERDLKLCERELKRQELRRSDIIIDGYALGEVDIIYTGDIHGSMTPLPTKEGGTAGGISYMAGLIRELERENAGHTILVDVGDWGQGSLESNMDKGRTMLEAMNAVGYDAVQIGNHEFDWGREGLEKLLPEVRFPLLGANILKEDGKFLDGVKPYIIKEVNGIKVGIIGVITDAIRKEGDPGKVAGLTFLNSIETVKKYTEELKREEKADVVMVLSHQGDEYDKKLAEEVGDIVIIGGHSHNKIIDNVNNTLIAKSGTKGKQVGHLKLVINKKDKELLWFNHELITVPGDMEPDREVEKAIASAVKVAGQKKSEVIGSLAFDLSHDRLKVAESPMGDFVTDAIRKATGSDMAMIASSELRNQIFKGEVTFGALYDVLPRDDNQCICIDLTGEQVKNIMENSAAQPKNYLQVSGIAVDIDRTKNTGSKVSNVKVNGKPLETDKVYRIAINDILVTGPCGYADFTKGKNIEYGANQRDMVMDYMKQGASTKTLPEMGRLNFIN